MAGSKDVIERIQKDIRMFDGSVDTVESMLNSEQENSAQTNGTHIRRLRRILELARMYRSDSESFLDKGDTDTSFSCISYAHGLLDSLRELLKGDVFENREEGKELKKE